MKMRFPLYCCNKIDNVHQFATETKKNGNTGGWAYSQEGLYPDGWPTVTPGIFFCLKVDGPITGGGGWPVSGGGGELITGFYDIHNNNNNNNNNNNMNNNNRQQT